ncbi:MAPEG family protein [Pseudohalioglobus sediminis]|uniref:MAPEG family protein n=1 Tax=Pseudohalioglobus sediminis TaxID=2606449 RepID=A0A5B0WPC7_9GAMM|nr:MAPEG family protein [Pseudohalioglobus sediminis]KAA1188910.1 MAPEG family protein [Pseudohalioglobus sediminis]
MAYVALVTLLLLIQYTVYTLMCGFARGKDTVVAPATSGDETFERAFRVQMNTLEQLMVTLPAMWVCAYFYSPYWAAGFGVMFMIGRLVYRQAYMKDPASRGPGMMIGFIANVALIALGAWGALSQL